VSLLSRAGGFHPNHLGSQGHRKRTKNLPREQTMKKEYDLSKMKFRRNPYAKRLKKQITIRMGVDVLDYFKALAQETGIPYQSLINSYLRDCVVNQKKPSMPWAS
jgi:uncharacterized protein (DUF4415 family)